MPFLLPSPLKGFPALLLDFPVNPALSPNECDALTTQALMDDFLKGRDVPCRRSLFNCIHDVKKPCENKKF